MTESAPDPVTPSSEVDPKRRRRWPHIVGVIGIGLIALGAIVVAIAAVVACSDRKCGWGHGQHLLAVLGTLTAALASFRQGRTAKTKSVHHRDAAEAEEKATPQGEEATPLKRAHDREANHFKTVSVWWYTFFVGAVAAVCAEFIDWSGVTGQ